MGILLIGLDQPRSSWEEMVNSIFVGHILMPNEDSVHLLIKVTVQPCTLPQHTEEGFLNYFLDVYCLLSSTPSESTAT